MVEVNTKQNMALGRFETANHFLCVIHSLSMDFPDNPTVKMIVTFLEKEKTKMVELGLKELEVSRGG